MRPRGTHCGSKSYSDYAFIDRRYSSLAIVPRAARHAVEAAAAASEAPLELSATDAAKLATLLAPAQRPALEEEATAASRIQTARLG